ncbi:Retinoic acid induced 16-like protein-domain-containing protein [Truncatella angustata]|uniref:Retinoic acid induced 16-like protein-domain-containing protein n=1 Tax=Truncatella angustata TaxID=152316 RepID=A0A9P8UI18_9PEZI|nr:Retinoic acid induced 16-like protein-domain-containing protein [Truncatella angustata]KAH6652572.1 Retinoic acid induced 16-like protein-domain-containing protein [Truncatella angustata]
MDFWSRIIAPLSSGGSNKDATRDPIRRRQRFEKEYSQLLHIWRNTSNIAKDVDAAENLEIRLQELTNILADESRRPLPHPCISFSAAKQIYVPIGKIATTSYNEWIIKEAVSFFATLIESEEEAFVENEAFSASLTNLLVRITGANSIRLAAETEVRVVELAFNITTKIRLEPHILPAWFKSHQHGSGPNPQQEDPRAQREKFAGKTQKQDFPLFYLLMDYIHHEGKVGDFARTGLLYIIESASNSAALEQWIVESDLSTLMATGLGALYSQLSRKLVIDHPPQELPPVLALSDYQHPSSTFEIISSCSPDFKLHLDTFLAHLLFWQDVLNHCRSTEVKSTLLEHFQVIFLQQLLYPSLLESSDVDGGSSVAVLTYLKRILEALDHPDMINLILHYLLALPDADAPVAVRAEPAISAARKRKSMDLATMMEVSKLGLGYSPLLFNLVDLIHSCLKSKNQQTVCVTLQLLAVILKRHHRYAVITLLQTEGVHGSSSHRTRGAHEQEVEFLTTLAGSVGGQDNFDEIYDNIVKDTMSRLEGHPCSLKLVAPKVSVNNHKLPAIPDSLPGAPRDVPHHTLSPEDPLLNSLLDLLETFFLNPVETNLSLTETIIDLGVCGYITIEGWLLRHPHKYSFDDDDEVLPEPVIDSTSDSTSESQKLQAMLLCRRRPRWQTSSLPRALAVLETVADQVVAFKNTIPRFEELLQQRREAFQTADTIVANPAPARTTSGTGTPAPDRPGLEARASSPARPGGLESFAQRLLSELGTPSRSASPRGRKESGRNISGSSGTSEITGSTISNSKPIAVPPKQFPTNHQSPTRTGLSRSFSPGGQATGRDSPVASQMAAFAAIDQSILSRKVRLPTLEVAPIPLDFGKKSIATNESEVPVANVEDVAQPAQGESPQEGVEMKIPAEAPAEATAEVTVAAPTETQTPTEAEDASVSHVLTNVIIFQSFLLELAALVQVRAGMFNEVRFV